MLEEKIANKSFAGSDSINQNVENITDVLMKRLKSDEKIKISEMDKIVEKVIANDKENIFEYFKLDDKKYLNSRLLREILCFKLDKKILADVGEKTCHELMCLYKDLDSSTKKYLKNHSHIIFKDFDDSLKFLNEARKDIENLDKDPSEDIFIKRALAASIGETYRNIEELKDEKYFFDRISQHIDTGKIYYHCSCINLEQVAMIEEGKYILQPGIVNMYGDGVYFSEKPLLPYARRNQGEKVIIFTTKVNDRFSFNRAYMDGDMIVNAHTANEGVKYNNPIVSEIDKKTLERMGCVGLDEALEDDETALLVLSDNVEIQQDIEGRRKAFNHLLFGVDEDSKITCSVKKEELAKVFDSYTGGEKLINLLSGDFAQIMDKDVGTWEKYTLREHTELVLKQFDYYYSNKNLPLNIDKNLFRIILALHDIGKPIAVAQRSKNLQHKYTVKILEDYLPKIGFDEKQIKIAKAILKSDPVGEVAKNSRYNEQAVVVQNLAKEVGITNQEMLELLEVLYKCDAGSYTRDAGGKESLDYLFEFDREKREINYSKSMDEKISILRGKLDYQIVL
ncbi:MAG: hypothetical protein ACOZAR_00520 [Patescibacteria group bacterium]